MAEKRFHFQITAKCGSTRARAGVMTTAHGAVHTPIFMPVGTLGTVKALTPDDLKACGAQVVLGNTYHLYLRPGTEVLEPFGGLHRFMGWDRSILTDSGGFQIFSISRLTRVTDEGAEFQSHIDGSRHRISPEKAIDIQQALGSDIAMCLDQCIAYPSSPAETEAALERTTRWAGRCAARWRQAGGSGQALFGIVQGGMLPSLRKRSVEALAETDLPGYAVGGLSVGEPKELMWETADFTLPLLPPDRPRYVMGVGTPEDLVEMVAMGADMFDCVLPTRNARNGQLFTAAGAVNIANARFKDDPRPLEENCACYTCRSFSRAYLRHLYQAKELLSYRLNTLHNVHYFLSLAAKMRSAIAEDRFSSFRKEFYRLREAGKGI